MDIQVIFEVTEESFDAVSSCRNSRIGQVVEHIVKCPFDGLVRSSEQFVRVPIPACFQVEALLAEVFSVAFLPVIQAPFPADSVVVCFDLQDQKNQPSQLLTGNVFGVLGQPDQAHALNMHQTALYGHIRHHADKG